MNRLWAVFACVALLWPGLVRGDSQWIYGIHWYGNPASGDVEAMTGNKGIWDLETVMLYDGGWSMNDQASKFQAIANKGHTVVIRIQPRWGWSIPAPAERAQYLADLQVAAQQAANFCHIWQIGNEMNLYDEYGGGVLTASEYVNFYKQVRNTIKGVSSPLGPQIVLVGGVSPGAYYQEVRHTDGLVYLEQMCDALGQSDTDGFALHAYGAPWLDAAGARQDFKSGYTTQLDIIDANGFCNKPAFILEWNRQTNPINDAWQEEQSSRFLIGAFQDLAAWNANADNHPIVCAAWFIYPDEPGWDIFSILKLRSQNARGVNLDMWDSFQYACGLSIPAGSMAPTCTTNGRVIRIEAEDIKFVAGVAQSNDTTVSTNSGGQRHPANYSKGVDIETCSEGGYDVGWINNGEWIDYSVPGDGGQYTLRVRYAASDAGQIRVYINGVSQGTISLPASGGYQSWATATGPTVTIPAGVQTFRWECLDPGFNLNYFEFVSQNPGPQLLVADDFDYPFPNHQDWYCAGDLGDYYNSTYHPGEDWNIGTGGHSDWGETVYAVANGKVLWSGYSASAWGNIVYIEHTMPDSTQTWSQFAHLEQRFVRAGDNVVKGQPIGTVGAGANDLYWAHLHFEMRKVNRGATDWVTGWSYAQVEGSYYDPSDLNSDNYPGPGFIETHQNLSGNGPIVLNASFEGNFTNGVADGWVKWTSIGSPTFNAASVNYHDGAHSQYWARTDSAAFMGGVYQQVSVDPGQSYSLGAWLKRQSIFGGTALAFGYDLNGGTDPGAASVLWTDLMPSGNNVWIPYNTGFVATGNTVTLFSKGGHTDESGDTSAYFYLDQVALTESGGTGLTVVDIDIENYGADPMLPWTVHVTTANVRSEPTTSSSILGSLSSGAQVSGTLKLVLESDEEWLEFDYSGQTAYLSATTIYRIHPDNNVTGNIPIGSEIATRYWGMSINYAPNDLQSLPSGYALGGSTSHQLRAEALAQLTAMFDDAAADSVHLRVGSSYRSGTTQKTIYDNNVAQYGLDQRFSAPPGHSEHQLGTTVDLSDSAGTYYLSQNFDTTAEYAWLANHAAAYGFYLSYREDNAAETGYIYEPWHWRYEGAPSAVDPLSLGKGMWVWYLSSTYSNLGVADYNELFDYCVAHDLDWVTVKCGDGTTAWTQFSQGLVDAAHARGLKIFGWTYVYGDDPVAEANVAIASLDKGADGFIIDAEGEYKNKPTQAETLCQTIRAAYPTTFLAYAPYTYIQYHTTYPFVQFGKYCDAVMPQAYWHTIGVSPTEVVADMNENYNYYYSIWEDQGNGDAIKPVIPIGQTYGGTTAAETTEWFAALNADPNPPGGFPYGGTSFWSAQHITASEFDAIRDATLAPTIGVGPGSTIVDNLDADFNIVSGTWPVSTGVKTWYYLDYLYANSGTGSAVVEWAPTLAAGDYEIFVWYCQATTRPTNAPYTVYHSSGQTAVTVNQQVNGRSWVSLGTFNLNSSSKVRLSNNCNGTYVIADAVCFTPVNGTPTPTPTPTATPSPTPVPPGDAYIGLDANAPIIESTGDITANYVVVGETGTPYVRVNFILGPWNTPGDSSLHGSHNGTWFQTYDQIINGYVAQGIEVYGLIGAQAVHSSSSVNSAGYVSDYVNNFVTIVDRYKDRIRVFESFNEPNDWAGGSSAQVQPYYFAKMLHDIYRAVKIDNGHISDPAWQVTLVSGPLFTHDLDTGASYLNSVYTEGINNLGWSTFRSTYGTYPLDGIGFHMYVAEGSSVPATIRSAMQTNMNATWNVVTTFEGSGTPKKFWISEFGWRDDYVGGEAAQASNLTESFDELLNDSRVQLAMWFSLTDFPGAKYGLFKEGGLTQQNKKLAWQAFFDLTGGQPAGPITVTGETATSQGSLSVLPSSSDDLHGNVATAISGGFHPANTNPADHEPAFTDGAGLGALTGLLNDYPGENTPAWKGYWNLDSGNAVDLTELRVFSGNGGKDGRVFHHYDVYTTTDTTPDASSPWTLLKDEVTPVAFGTSSGGTIEATLTKMTRSGAPLASGVTAIRIDFYAVHNQDNVLRDDWNSGNGDDTDGVAAAFVSPLIYEVDAWFDGGSNPTPTPSPSPSPTPSPSPSPSPTATPTVTPSPSPSPSPSPTPGPPTNLVQNGSFENGFTNGVGNNWVSWSASWSNPITFGRASTNKYDGSYSQYWTRGSSSTRFHGGVYQQISVTPGQTYNISAWMKRQGSASDQWMEFGYDLSGGTNAEAGSVVYTKLEGLGYNVWVQYTATVTATGSTITLFGKAGHYNQDGNNNYFYLDAVSMMASGATPTPTPSPSPTPSGPIVNNGSFENGFTNGVGNGWTSWASSWSNPITFGQASANKYDGSYSQYWTRGSSSTRFHGGVYQTVSVTSGQSYTITARMKRQGSASDQWMEFGYDLSGGTNAEGGSVVYTKLEGLGYDVWVTYSATVTATGSTMTLFAKGGHWNQDGNSNYFYVDAVAVNPN